MYAGFRNLIPQWRLWGLAMGKVGGVEFLFRDDFLTDEAAPLTSPRTAEPGPGTLVLTDTGNVASIIGGVYTVVNSTGAGDPKFHAQDSFVRAAGVSLFSKVQFDDDGTVAFDDAAGIDNTPNSGGLRFDGTNLIFFPGNFAVDTVVVNTEYEVAIATRAVGAFAIIKGGTFTNWTLVWVDDAIVDDPIFAQWNPLDAGDDYQIDYFRVSQLPPPWDTDYGIATDRLAGSRGLGDTWIHEADFVGEFICTTVPGAGTIFWSFRRQDANNYWEVIIEPSQDITLREVVGGVPTARGTAVGVVNNGDRIVVIADDETIRVYVDNALEITYALAATFKTETDGELLGIGTGAVDDIVLWPRVISGSALSSLNRVANA